MDTIAGSRIGLVPSGLRDPYALAGSPRIINIT
jgi:glycyl-tRNA synthetase beta subunit